MVQFSAPSFRWFFATPIILITAWLSYDVLKLWLIFIAALALINQVFGK